MSDRLSSMRSARRTYTVQWRKFLIRTAEDANSELHCFVEGHDEQYLTLRAELASGRTNLVYYPCDGKAGVLAVFRLATDKNLSKQHDVAFIVDRDFDRNLDESDDPRIYTTPCYSIENQYISERVVQKILRNEFGLRKPEDQAELESVTQIVSARLLEFANLSIAHNAWLAAARQEQRNATRAGFSLNDTQATDWFDIRLNGVSVKFPAEDLPTLFGPKPKGINRWAKWLSESPLLRNRGKFLLQALRTLLEALKVDRRKRSNWEYFSKRGNVPIQLSKINIISELSQYADTPQCLVEYFQQFQTPQIQ